jgi:formiminoglutamate deiminase
MTTYWAAHAQLGEGLASRVRFSVVDGRFASIVSEVDPEPTDERLAGVVLPGLANVHSHAFHRVLRGRTHSDGGTFWTWRQSMYAVAQRLDPDRYLALARAVYAEMALAGWTVVGEFHYLHHGPGGRSYADLNAMGRAVLQAAAEAGLKITLLDTCYLAGGLTGDGHLDLDAIQQRFSDGNVDAWADRVRHLDRSVGPQVKIGAAIHSVRAVPAPDLARVAELSAGRPLHLHLSEQPAENAAVRAHYGCSPTELAAGSGVLGPRTTAVHATHLSDTDIAQLGATATTAGFCPTTERDLADGIGPARRLVDAGSPLSLGSDSHAVLDPFEELRGLEMHERLVSGRRGRFTPGQLIEAASSAGYRSLGWEGGRISEGAPADFVVVRSDSIRTTGCSPDQIVFAATATDVDRVVVDGRTIVADGVSQLGPVQPLLAAALEELAP